MQELVSLAEADRKIALDRFRILQPHLQQGRGGELKKRKFTHAKARMCENPVADGALFAASVFRNFGLCPGENF